MSVSTRPLFASWGGDALVVECLGDLGPFGAVNLHRLHDKSVLFRRRPFQIEVGVQVVGPPVRVWCARPVGSCGVSER